MKLSCIYGKKTLSAEEKEGYVTSVCADGFKITGFKCADGDETEFFIPVEKIKRIKDKIIYAQSGTASGKPVNLGKPSFDCEGNYLGKLTDVTAENYMITAVNVGNKKFSADDIVLGDAVLIKSSARILKSDVKKNGKILIKRGTPLSPDVLKKAQEKGEYVQTNLKSI